jgi:tetratricopeptide (TPR) repeat protein
MLLLFAAVAASAQNPAFRKGAELFQQARYEEALHEFEQAARADPGNAVIENALGLAETKLNRIEEADRHYEAAVRLNPKLAGAHRNLGVNYLNAKHYDAAEKQFRQALALEPGDPFPHYYLALVFLSSGRDEQAVAEAGPARALLANDPDAEFQMAKASLRTGHTELGLDLVGALEKVALSPAQEFELATLLNAKRLFPQTVAILRRIVQANPGAWVNRYNLADALVQAGETSEAVTVLESLSAERPQDALVLSLLGSAYENTGQKDRALECYRNAVAAAPGNHDYYLDYARLLADLNRYDQSEKFIESSLQQFSGDYALTIRLGALQMMQGKLEEARHTFESAINANPNVVLGHVALAQTYLRERRDEDAARVLGDARGKLPPDAMVEHYYGLALVRMQRFRDALAPLQESARLDPDDPETYYLLGKADAALNRNEAARTDFERVIALDPRHAGAHYQLSRVYAQLGDAAKAQEMAELTKKLIRSQREDGLKAQRARLGKLEPNQ